MKILPAHVDKYIYNIDVQDNSVTCYICPHLSQKENEKERKNFE